MDDEPMGEEPLDEALADEVLLDEVPEDGVPMYDEAPEPVFPDNEPGHVAADDNDPSVKGRPVGPSAAGPSAAEPSAAEPSAAGSSAGNSPPGKPWDAGQTHAGRPRGASATRGSWQSYGWQSAGHTPKPGSGSGAASAAGDGGQPPRKRSTTPRPSWKKDTASDYGDSRLSASAAGTNMEDMHMPTAMEIIKQLDIDESAMQARHHVCG
jgi:hypothetical protein